MLPSSSSLLLRGAANAAGSKLAGVRSVSRGRVAVGSIAADHVRNASSAAKMEGNLYKFEAKKLDGSQVRKKIFKL